MGSWQLPDGDETPLAGDVEFEPAAAAPRAPRMLLHAYQIEFDHPGNGKPAVFRAPLPEDFLYFWKACVAVSR